MAKLSSVFIRVYPWLMFLFLHIHRTRGCVPGSAAPLPAGAGRAGGQGNRSGSRLPRRRRGLAAAGDLPARLQTGAGTRALGAGQPVRGLPPGGLLLDLRRLGPFRAQAATGRHAGPRGLLPRQHLQPLQPVSPLAGHRLPQPRRPAAGGPRRPGRRDFHPRRLRHHRLLAADPTASRRSTSPPWPPPTPARTPSRCTSSPCASPTRCFPPWRRTTPSTPPWCPSGRTCGPSTITSSAPATLAPDHHRPGRPLPHRPLSGTHSVPGASEAVSQPVCDPTHATPSVPAGVSGYCRNQLYSLGPDRQSLLQEAFSTSPPLQRREAG